MQLTGYGYDMASRLLQTAYADGLDDTFAYDNDGRQIQSLSARYGVQVDKTYLPNGQLASETTTRNSESKTVSYTHDAANRQTGVTYPDGKQVTRAFNGRDQLTNVAFDNAPVASYTLDNGGRIMNITSANGVNETRTYRADNQLRTIGAQNANGVPLTGLQYTIDADKRRTAEADLVNSLLSNQYGYDKQDQLTAWNRMDGKTGAWNLSLGGDWNSVTYDGITETRTHDAAHELLARNTTPLSYDPRGNLTADSDGRILTWDPENRLVSVTPATPAEGSIAVSFAYDTQCRRVGKQIFTWSTATSTWTPATTTRFTYDGWNLISEQSNGPTVQPSDRNYIWGTDLSGTLQGAGGIGGLLAGFLTKNEEPGTRNLVFYHYQANGNIMALTDSSGAVAARYAYSPYGTLLATSGSLALQNPFRFSTKYTDDETGLVYYGYRFFSPQFGRWFSRDPAQEKGGLNLFQFVGDNPIQKVDYIGLWDWPGWIKKCFTKKCAKKACSIYDEYKSYCDDIAKGDVRESEEHTACLMCSLYQCAGEPHFNACVQAKYGACMALLARGGGIRILGGINP